MRLPPGPKGERRPADVHARAAAVAFYNSLLPLLQLLLPPLVLDADPFASLLPIIRLNAMGHSTLGGGCEARVLACRGLEISIPQASRPATPRFRKGTTVPGAQFRAIICRRPVPVNT